MKLWEFMRDNLPFAFYGNVNNEYSEEEYKSARNNLKPVLGYFQGIDEDLLSQSFACVIRHIKFVKNEYDQNYSKEFMQEKGRSWNQYHKMIFEFNRAMQSFTYSFEGETERWGKTFPIKEVIFKGQQDRQVIKLEGQVLEILQGLFKSFNSIYGKSDEKLMKDFSFDFYKAYHEFMMQWQIVNAPKGTIARRLVKAREVNDNETAFNKYRNQTAYYIHSFLKKNNSSKASIPEWHKKFIGELFITCDIAHDEDEATPGFVGASYNAVRRWIEEGEKSLK